MQSVGDVNGVVHANLQGTVVDPGFLRGCANLLFGKNFAENCMKMKEYGPRRKSPLPTAPSPMDPPLGRNGYAEIKPTEAKIFFT